VTALNDAMIVAVVGLLVLNAALALWLQLLHASA
jgi:hypothetical protein